LHVRAGAPAVIVRREDLIVTREERERFERDHATLLSEPISACKLRAGGGIGLPIIGRLLGHTQAATTARYPHLDNDPLRRASEAIAGRIAAALDGKKSGDVVPIARRSA
jgi:integrase